MSNYTEADVKRWAKEISNSLYVSGDGVPLSALTSLVDAALEGAKVPGLVAQVNHWREATEEVAKNRAEESRAALAEVSALQARVAVLQQDARTASDAMDAAQARATEAEKRVTELGRERDAKAGQHERQMLGAKQTVDAVRELQARAESERDVLRAQVKALDEALDEAIQEVEGYDGEAAVALRRAQEAALSAPPAETTPAPVRYAPDTEDRRRPCNDDDE